jgi:PAS domain S-box-containing protein
MDRRLSAGFLKIFLPLLLLVGGGAAALIYAQHQQAAAQRDVAEVASLQRAVNNVEMRFGRTLRDIAFLSRHAAMQAQLNLPKPDSLSQIAHNFLAFSSSQGVYDQIRWIDETGFERVRVEYNDGKPRLVPEGELQDKSKRYYFVETMQLSAEQIFVSPLDLNVETEVVEQPFKPMIRIGMPLFDHAGKRRGMILLNYFGKDLIDGFIMALAGSGRDAMLLNQDGYWLHASRAADEWGFMFGRAETFATRYPAQWMAINSSDNGQVDTDRDLWSWATVYPFKSAAITVENAVIKVANPYHWKIVSRLPSRALLASEAVAMRSVVLYCLILLIPGALGSFAIARTRAAHEDAMALAARARMDESESRFELLLSSSTNGLLVIAEDGTVVRANAQAETVFGYPMGTMHGMSVDALVPAHIHAAHAQLRERYMMQPTARRLGRGRELSARRRDRSEFPVEISLAPLQMQGKTYVLTTVIDISERKQAEAHARSQQLLLDRMSHLARVGGWRFDVATRKGSWSDEVARIHDVDPDDKVTVDFGLEFFPPESRSRVEAAITAAIREAVPYDLELEFISAKGVRKWVRTQGIPSVVAGRVVSVEGAIQDITDRKRAELEIQALNADLEQRVRLRTEELAAANKELEAFAYAVSHDLRAPLRAMMGFSQALVEDCSDQLDDVGRDYVDEIISASRSMGSLIDGLLTLSRSTQGLMQRDPVDLSTMARSIATDLALSEPERQVVWQIEDGMMAKGDTRMIQIALQNLLANAWKYTARVDQPTIRFYSEHGAAGTRFIVADSGAGFDMGHADRLFKPFQRLHRQDEFAGIGIGLATVQRVVSRHGGSIEAEAAPGQGAIFKFSLGTDESQEVNG